MENKFCTKVHFLKNCAHQASAEEIGTGEKIDFALFLWSPPINYEGEIITSTVMKAPIKSCKDKMFTFNKNFALH